jgi:glycine reductase
VARPGESIRVLHILDAIEPRCKRDEGQVFPGFFGQPGPAGSGVTHALDGMTVLVCGEAPGLIDSQLVSEAIVDMDGPAAPYSPFARTLNLVLTCRFRDGQGPIERVAAARRAGLLAARLLAETTLGHEPLATRHYTLAPTAPTGADASAAAARVDIPRVAYICPGMALSALHQTFLDGVPLNVTPAVLHPAELLDGAVVSGNYDIAATRNPTYMYQRNPIVEELFARHAAGELVFVGMVVTLCLINPYLEKQRSASLAARAARLLGAEGVIISIEECGHAYADLMLTCQACEDIGLATVLVTAESAGAAGDKPAQLAFAHGADAVVSTGNMDQLITLPRVERVIGGDAIGQDAFMGRWPLDTNVHGPADTSLENIYAATCQVGPGLLRGEGC